MGTFIDISGKRYGRLVVLRRAPSAGKRITWFCRCDCGQETIKAGNNLYSGNTKSCGCLRVDTARSQETTHGMSNTPGEYAAWVGMLERCNNSKGKNYPRYGARGIRVCNRWLNSFENFFTDMGLRPSPHHSIDRYPDNDGDYESSNCRWATKQEQARNRRSNIIVSFAGREMSLKEATEIAGLPYVAVYLRIIRRGWAIDRALTEPMRRTVA